MGLGCQTGGVGVRWGYWVQGWVRRGCAGRGNGGVTGGGIGELGWGWQWGWREAGESQCIGEELGDLERVGRWSEGPNPGGGNTGLGRG